MKAQKYRHGKPIHPRKTQRTPADQPSPCSNLHTTSFLGVSLPAGGFPQMDCDELLAQFEADVAEDGRIDLHRQGDMSSFLSVRYSTILRQGKFQPIKNPISMACLTSTKW